MLHCGWVDQRRGKGHGPRAGHKVKGRPTPRIPSEFMHFPGKPPDLATKAFPMGRRERRTAVSLLPSDNQPAKPTRMLVNLSLAAHTGRDNSGLSSYEF